MMEQYISTKIVLAEPENMPGMDGYRVRYKDGNTAWIPATAFNASYRLSGSLPIGLALDAVKQGKKAMRRHWPVGTFIMLCQPTLRDTREGVEMNSFGLSVKSSGGIFISSRKPGETPFLDAWTPTTQDLIEEDWMLIE